MPIPSDNFLNPDSPWRDFHYETRLDLTNNSQWDYEAIDILITATDPVVQIIGLDSFPVAFIPDGHEGIRVRTDHLPKVSSLHLIVATVNFNRGPGIPLQLFGPRRAPEQIALFGEFKARLRPYKVSQVITVIHP